MELCQQILLQLTVYKCDFRSTFVGSVHALRMLWDWLPWLTDILVEYYGSGDGFNKGLVNRFEPCRLHVLSEDWPCFEYNLLQSRSLEHWISSITEWTQLGWNIPWPTCSWLSLYKKVQSLSSLSHGERKEIHEARDIADLVWWFIFAIASAYFSYAYRTDCIRCGFILQAFQSWSKEEGNRSKALTIEKSRARCWSREGVFRRFHRSSSPRRNKWRRCWCYCASSGD